MRSTSPSSRGTRETHGDSIEPCYTGDLSAGLIESYELPAHAGLSSWQYFMKTMRRQGVPFSAISHASLPRRLELVQGVFPRSQAHQQEVMREWPEKPTRYPTTLPPSVLLRIHGNQSPRVVPPRRSTSRERSLNREDVELRPPRQNSPPAWHSPAIARARAAARVATARKRVSVSPRRSSSHIRSASVHSVDKSMSPRGVRQTQMQTQVTHSPRSSPMRTSRDASFSRLSEARSIEATSPRRGLSDVSPYRECRGSLPVGCVVVARKVRRLLPELEGAKGKVLSTITTDGRVAVQFPAPFHEMYVPANRLIRAEDNDIDLEPPTHKKVSVDCRYMRVAVPPPLEEEPLLLDANEAMRQLLKAEQHGTSSTEYAIEAWRLAECLQHEGIHQDAIEHARTAVEHFIEKGVGGGRRHLLGAVSICAAALNDAGYTEEAVDLLANTASQLDVQNSMSETDVRLVHNLAVLCHLSGDSAVGEYHATAALEGFARTCGTEHPSTLLALSNLALLYHDQGRLPEAAVLASRSSLTLEDDLPDAPAPYVAALKRALYDIMRLAQGTEATYTVLLEKGAQERSGLSWSKTVLGSVAKGSPGARCGLHRFKGRRLVEINGRGVSRVAEIRAAFDNASFHLLTFSRESLQSTEHLVESPSRFHE